MLHQRNLRSTDSSHSPWPLQVAQIDQLFHLDWAALPEQAKLGNHE